MNKETKAKNLRWLLLGLVFAGLAAALVILPNQFRSMAGGQNDTGEGMVTRTSSQDDGLVKMYDIREDKDQGEKLLEIRDRTGKSAVEIADVRGKFVEAENELRRQIPTVKVEYNNDIRIPEVITPDVWKQNIDFLTAPTRAKRTEILSGFLKQHNDLVGMSDDQITNLNVAADYTNPDGNLSYVHLEQLINGVPVFRGEVKAGFTKNNQIIRIINNLAPGLDYGSLSADFRNPLDAVKASAAHINHELTTADVTRNDSVSNDLKVIFGNGDWATTAEKMYFPTEPGVAVPAWRVLIWQPVSAYYVIVDAQNGVVLWHKNISDDQLQTATYEIYGNPPSYVDTADHVAPLSPGPTNPTLGTQGALIARTNRTLIGNEGAPLINNGWITDNTNITDGNFNEAGIDRVAPNGVDAPQVGDTGCPGAGCRVFTSLWNPPPGNPAPGDAPLTAAAQRGAVIQMFYIMNRFQTELHKRGFTEEARNFQHDNFGRGGVANDRVSSEGQDSSGTNNANFATGADGVRGRMQMFIWTGPEPDRDGTPDADIVIHEVTHGLSNRLHGNGTGLGNQGGMMGEGWGDWYAHAMLAEPTDPINGIYAVGGYSLFLASGTMTSNYYYGIRRFPTAVLAFTGGPNNLPHNPLTFGHINVGCDTTLGTTAAAVSSAYPRNPVFGPAANCSQVHNAGEIWKSALWEVRAKVVTRLGFTAGTTRVLQFVTDGMKLAPLNPSMLQERDAIIAAAAALPVAPESSADVADIRDGFRIRGMGFSAVVTSATVVTEAFDFANVQHVDPFSVSDAPGDGDGFPEPGEDVLLSVAVRNATGGTITNVQANVNGGTNVAYGTINDGQTVTMQIPYTIPVGPACGSFHQVAINVSSSIGAQAPINRQFRLGAPIGGAPTTFENNTLINLPAGQPGTTSGIAAPYPTSIDVSGVAGNKIIRVEVTGVTHTFPGDLDFLLVSPAGQKYILLSDSGGAGDVLNLTFTLRDGAAALPSTTQWVAGDFRPHNVGANDVFAAPAPAPPYTNAAPGGTDTFLSTFGMSGAAMNGTWSLYAVDDAGGDFGTMAGWKITFESDDYICSLSPIHKRADFDGDGRTDLSVFRPSEGNWYVNGSTDGFKVTKWGNSTDSTVPNYLVPGDYDADGKTDHAVFRPSNAVGTPDFYILRSNGFVLSGVEWGNVNDVPVVSDFDLDGRADAAVFRPGNRTWYVLNSGNGSNTIQAYGLAGDIPVAGNFVGDGRADFNVFRPSNGTWYSRLANGGDSIRAFGLSTDKLVPADYDGDKIDDLAVYRPSEGRWYILRSTNGSISSTAFGISTDVPVPGDYDGDGSSDIAVYRNGLWYLLQSTSGSAVRSFGTATDSPVPARYIP